MLRLFGEMAHLFQYGTFQFEKKRYTISQAGVLEALKMMNNQSIKTPLTNHNYLKKIMISIARTRRPAAKPRR